MAVRRDERHHPASPRDQRNHRSGHLQDAGGGVGAGLVEEMRRRSYTARCERAGDWWAISVPELRGVHTQARRLEKVEAVVRDAIALFLDVAPDSFDITVEPVLPRELQKKVGRVRKVRAEAEVMQRQAAAESADVAADLVKGAHLTVRDAGRVLGLSHQRITQLLKPARMTRRRAARAARDSQRDSHRGT